jgi:hypothetical protein
MNVMDKRQSRPARVRIIPVAEALKKGNVSAPREPKKGDARGRRGGKAIVIYGFGKIVFNGRKNYTI